MSYADNIVRAIKDARNILKKVPLLPDDAYFPAEVKKVNNFTEETVGGLGRLSALSLLVYLSPSTGEPLSMRVNTRDTQIRSMMETSVIDVLKDGKQVSIPVNFLDDLLQDKKMNPVVAAGSHPIHFFAAAAEHTTLVPLDDALPELVDNYLQTWMSVEYHLDNEIIPKTKVVLTSEQLRDVSVQDINKLHYLLNIPHFFKETTVDAGDIPQSIVFFKFIFEKLQNMPLHDYRVMRAFVHNDLGIPLFKDKDYMPIHEQWTQLSYFLQMCSNVCLSPIEGGHRTLQMIKFFTGADFTNKSPQPFKPLHRSSNWTDILPAKKIHQHGLAMTTYNISFWQRFDKTNLLGGNDAFELRLQSNWFQQSFKVVCKDTNDNLLAKVLQKLDTLFKCKDGDQFTTTKFFQNVDDSIKKLDARMMQAYPVILECVKTISPAKEQFAILTAALKRKYDAATPSLKSVPLYSNLHRSLVSAAAPLFHFQ